MTKTVQCGSSRIMLRAGTGVNGTLTQVASTFLMVRFGDVMTAGAPETAAPERAAAVLLIMSRRLMFIRLEAELQSELNHPHGRDEASDGSRSLRSDLRRIRSDRARGCILRR